MIYALINLATEIVENSIILDNENEFQIPSGYLLIQSDKPIGTPYKNGNFVIPVITVDPNYEILQEIFLLETSITARRRDEAILGIDKGWLAETRAKIDNLRLQLKK